MVKFLCKPGIEIYLKLFLNRRNLGSSWLKIKFKANHKRQLVPCEQFSPYLSFTVHFTSPKRNK